MTILTLFLLIGCLILLESLTSVGPVVKRGIGILITGVIVYFVLVLLGLVPLHGYLR